MGRKELEASGQAVEVQSIPHCVLATLNATNGRMAIVVANPITKLLIKLRNHVTFKLRDSNNAPIPISSSTAAAIAVSAPTTVPHKREETREGRGNPIADGRGWQQQGELL